jgi:RPA family protein
MSSTDSIQRRRNPARRVFAWEYKDATHEERRGDGDQAPRCVLLPTGKWANRLFVVGSLAQVIESDDSQYVRGEVVDPTGRFYVSAGQYQQKASEKMRQIDTPEKVAITGKTRVFDGDSGRKTQLRVTDINPVPDGLYDQWVAETARKTGLRLRDFRDDDNKAAAKAADIYGADLGEYQEEAVNALDRVIDLIEEQQGVSEEVSAN